MKRTKVTAAQVKHAEETIKRTIELDSMVESGTIFQRWNELSEGDKFYLTSVYKTRSKSDNSNVLSFYSFCIADDELKKRMLEAWGK